jgi:threonine aldolase
MMASSPPIDLRSDTVTRPTPGMRAAIAAAAVGDDQFGEDPTVNALQDRIATLVGKEAALWVPSGTMANQIALRLLTRPGDDVIVSRESHVVWYETGGAAANAGVQLTEVGSLGLFTAEEFVDAVKPRGHMTYPPTTVVYIENTHNRAGGIIFPAHRAEQICAAARERDIASYLDGARLWNASAASGRSMADLAAPFDLLSVALSKGLGAPGGSLLAGSGGLITRAVRYRRLFGGAMRQVGILAAAGLYALDQHLDHLRADHAHARLIADRLGRCSSVVIDPATVQTNIVIFGLAAGAPDAATVVRRAADRGVLVSAFGPRSVRAVTHLDVTGEQCERAADILAAAASATPGVAPTGTAPID